MPKTGDNDCNVNSSRYRLGTALCESIRYQAKSEQNVRQDLTPRVRHGEAGRGGGGEKVQQNGLIQHQKASLPQQNTLSGEDAVLEPLSVLYAMIAKTS